MANKKPNWAAWVLRFVGSLAYLAVVWQLWQSVSAVGAAGANVFSPVLFGLAVVASVSLFLVTLADLGGGNVGKEWSMKATLLGGFSLFALLPLVSGAWTSWSWVALVGFVLAYVGQWLEA
jgi:hypothetical protein